MVLRLRGAAVHPGDEVKKAQTRVPRGVVLACIIKSAMLFVFVTVLLFYIGPLETTSTAPLPLIYVVYHATGSKTAANTLVSLIAVVIFLALFNMLASVSRLVWAFASDNGMPFSIFFSCVRRVHSPKPRQKPRQAFENPRAKHYASQVQPHFKLPINALMLLVAVVVCLSLVYIASATPFNALISLQALALHVSYFLPILFLLLRKLRGPSISPGPFRLRALGIPINLFALAYLVYVVIWMPFPQVLPVTRDNMNYAGPIFGAVLVGALIHYLARGAREVPRAGGRIRVARPGILRGCSRSTYGYDG